MKPYSIINFIAEKVPEYSWDKLRDMNTILLPVEGEGYIDENGLKQGLFKSNRYKIIYEDDKKIYLELYINGELHSKGSYKDNLRDGIWEHYYDNGVLESKGPYKNNKRNGLWVLYYGNGRLRKRGWYENGEKEGIWVMYNGNGEIYEKALYEKGAYIKRL